MDYLRSPSSKSVNVAKQDNSEQLKKSINQNAQLKKANIRLKNQLVQIQKKLDAQINKRAMMKNSSGAVQQKELENAYKQIQIYKRQLKRLQKRNQPDAQQKIQQLNNTLKNKDNQIEQLKKQIKSLKKINSFQEKGLIQVAGQGVFQYWKDKQAMQKQLKKMQEKCENYQKELRKKSVSLKPLQHKNIENPRISVLQKQIQQHKVFNQKNKKEISIIVGQRNKYLEQLNESKKIISQKQKQIQGLNLKLIQLRKCLRPNRVKKQQQSKKNDEQNQKQILKSKHKIKNDQYTNQQAINDKDKKPNSKKQHYQKQNKKLAITHSFTQEQTYPLKINPKSSNSKSSNSQNIVIKKKIQVQKPSHQKYKRNKTSQNNYSQKNQILSEQIKNSGQQQSMDSKPSKINKIQTYPKIDQIGQSNAGALKFNDHVFGSKIIGISICLDSNNKICAIQGKYQKGIPYAVLEDKQYSEIIECGKYEFIHQIQGGMNEDFIQWLIFTTNYKKIIKVGTQKHQNKKFKFEIQENQYPTSFFGQITQISNQIYRLNRFGCFIEKL